MKAYHIDSTKQTVTAVEYHGLDDLRRLVGGYIEAACVWPNGDVIYVDEDGLRKGYPTGFAIPQRPDQPLAGNGVMVGREIGDTCNTRPPTMTLEKLTAIVQFVI